MKKYFTLFLIVISCLFVFCSCNADPYDVDNSTVEVVDILVAPEINQCQIIIRTTNNFSIIVAANVSCYDNRNIFLENKFICSQILDINHPYYLESYNYKAVFILQLHISDSTSTVVIDKLQIKKAPFDTTQYPIYPYDS